MNFKQIKSPAYVIEEAKLRKNLELMQYVQKQSGAEIILALKGYSVWHTFPMLKNYLAGATASSLNEARLIFEEMGVKAHTYAPAYLPEQFDEIMKYSSHITFNSINQWKLYRSKVEAFPEKITCGIRVNPEYSDVTTDLYNPAAPGSRLGEMSEAFEQFDRLPTGIEGLHFHTLCESTAESLERLLEAFTTRFERFLPRLKWINMGGGHLMTRKDYDVEHLIQILKEFKAKYDVQITLEPGSAVAWETGVLVARVLDVFESRGIKTLMLDVSFTAHMPDTLEMPYRPRIRGASSEVVKGKPTYRVGGMSCLAGDYHHEYSFDKTVEIGDTLVFEDMIHYTLVKTTMFNGVHHPSILMEKEDGQIETLREFSYQDYRNRMG